MLFEDSQDFFLASKSLSRYYPTIVNELMRLDTVWCRVACQEFENMVAASTRHSFYELHYLLCGKIEMKVDEESYELNNSNRLLIVPPNTFHSTDSAEEGTKKFVFAFSIETEDDYIQNAMSVIDSVESYAGGPRIEHLILTMLDYARAPFCMTNRLICNMLESILLDVLREVSGDGEEENYKRPQVFESDERFNQIQHFIAENIAFGISSNDVAEHLHVCIRHLNRITKQVAGCTVVSLINKERMKLLKKLLRSDLPLKVVAEKSGFSSLFSMNRFFYRRENMTTNEWRSNIEK